MTKSFHILQSAACKWLNIQIYLSEHITAIRGICVFIDHLNERKNVFALSSETSTAATHFFFFRQKRKIQNNLHQSKQDFKN